MSFGRIASACNAKAAALGYSPTSRRRVISGVAVARAQFSRECVRQSQVPTKTSRRIAIAARPFHTAERVSGSSSEPLGVTGFLPCPVVVRAPGWLSVGAFGRSGVSLCSGRSGAGSTGTMNRDTTFDSVPFRPDLRFTFASAAGRILGRVDGKVESITEFGNGLNCFRAQMPAQCRYVPG